MHYHLSAYLTYSVYTNLILIEHTYTLTVNFIICVFQCHYYTTSTYGTAKLQGNVHTCPECVQDEGSFTSGNIVDGCW